MTKLQANHLAMRFGRRLLFRDLSFAVSGGDSLAITGSNGSGKSTLLRIIAGVLTPASGSVRMYSRGMEIDQAEHSLHVGLVAPYLNAYDAFSPRENLAFIARARRLPNGTRRIDEMLKFVDLAGRSDDPVATFSSGMKQRVKYAAALLCEPPVLLLDEPRVNLDQAGLDMVDRVLERQRMAGGVTLIATNDAAEVAQHANHIRIEDFRR